MNRNFYVKIDEQETVDLERTFHNHLCKITQLSLLLNCYRTKKKSMKIPFFILISLEKKLHKLQLIPDTQKTPKYRLPQIS